ncbi:MAG: tRNA (adenine-N1)-methyltransferase [Dehalococcoidia bacterium]|nr:tRNA (adenine-N1)-methyltransferase [Dehalococcoidia bacterium]MQG16264.1 tRNA (adenine-N1)-methyltransferase [SAR202 cluster bacterium]|tara:strand:+ start:1857 stop:2588 length:732 start_codon:yes stop_codon:yes gene_type:complete
MVKLVNGEVFNSHNGHFKHESLFNKPPGSWIKTSQGNLILALHPTMGDFTKLMPRTATVVYPKDLGAILVSGDIFPGAKVLEAGCGSGAVTISLMRAVGEKGHVYSYDIREDMIDRARRNVKEMLPDMNNVSIQLGDVSTAIEHDDLDRIVLDLPEPWKVVDNASKSLLAGGIFISFLPTVLQVHELSETLKVNPHFSLVETSELMVRSWHVAQRSIRPDHRMIGHTGFITTARKCLPIKPTD